MHYVYANNFAQWREQARDALQRGLTPLDIAWEAEEQYSFFDAQLPPANPTQTLSVSKGFLTLAEIIACHRSSKRWDLLYQLLFRLHCGEKELLRITTDPLMHALLQMQKAVRRDAHKMKAFVRFRRVEDEQGEHFIAWHQPDHFVVPLVSPFFARRFSVMRWTVLTPDASVHWDGQNLEYGPGVPKDQAPEPDTLEDLWRDYYRATFNPARIKLKMMKSEMPTRYWHTLPETQIIPDLLAEAPERVRIMLAQQQAIPQSAAQFLPPEQDIAHLREAARACEGCELHRSATQTVFGDGPIDAPLMLIGEQPGDEEDKTGKPFVGPAGALLHEALHNAGMAREEIYITNAVKHFRFLYKDSFRQHQSPSRYHVQACKPWLMAEIAAVKPQVIVCLGNTAARALIHPGFMMKTGRGLWQEGTPRITATYHPASILRATGSDHTQQLKDFCEDLSRAVEFASQKSSILN